MSPVPIIDGNLPWLPEKTLLDLLDIVYGLLTANLDREAREQVMPKENIRNKITN